jgi:hypothetical protein
MAWSQCLIAARKHSNFKFTVAKFENAPAPGMSFAAFANTARASVNLPLAKASIGSLGDVDVEVAHTSQVC